MSQALAKTEDIRIQSVDDLRVLGEILAKSNYFKDANDAGKAIVKVLAGRELGLAPIASMTGIYIVQGRVTLSANLMAAVIKRSGRYTYKVKRLHDTACEIEYFEGGGLVGVSSFTMEDAKKANLTASSDTWKKYPRNMMFARAMSNGARWYCADIFGGPTYTPDELGAQVDGETGEMIQPAASVTPMRPASAKVIEAEPVAPSKAEKVGGIAYEREKLTARISELSLTLRTMKHPAFGDGAARAEFVKRILIKNHYDREAEIDGYANLGNMPDALLEEVAGIIEGEIEAMKEANAAAAEQEEETI